MSAYNSAIAYYQRLKQQFITQLQNKALEKDLQLDSLTEEEFFNNLISASGTGEEFTRSKRLGQLIEEIYTKNFTGKNVGGEIRSLRNAARGKAKKSQKVLASQMRSILTSNSLSNDIDQAIFRAYGEGDISGADLSDLYNRIVNIMVRQLSHNKQIIRNQFNSQSAILAGYYHEIAAYQASEKLNSLLSTSHIGAANIQADIVYTLGQGNGKNPIEDYEQALNSLTGPKSFLEVVKIEDLNINSIKVFGNQVKLWQINMNKARIKGYSISHQTNLLNSFKASEKEQTQYKSVEWFNQNSGAIIQTFGPLNVMYFTGKERWWTSDLIEKAISSKYRLMFNQGKKQLTPMVKLDQKAYRGNKLISSLP